MPDLATELRHLVDANRQIAEAEAHLATVEQQHTKLATLGGALEDSERLLATMRDALAAFRDQRRLIELTIDDIRNGRI